MYGEELVYPDFRLRTPIFAPSRQRDDEQAWNALLNDIRERASRCAEDGWVCYRGQHGQNIIIANATYTGDPPADIWSDRACMSDGVSAQGIHVQEPGTILTDEEYEAKYPVDNLLIATSPDSWSFQHFLDRVVHIIAQGTHLTRTAPVHVVTGRASGKAVSERWDMLGIPANSVHHRGSVGAKAMVFSCRAPLIHPWLSYRALEKFGLNSTNVPLEKRKKVVYMSRSRGHTSNGGRRVLNEDDLLSQIRDLLSSRGQNEELVLFNQDSFRSQSELMRWFHDNARAIIGPHGGALFNHRWAGIDTLVLEMMPTTFTSLMFWEEASILGQVYVNMILEPVGGNDMNADIPAVLEILRGHLGKSDQRGPAISEMYRWRGPEVQVPFSN
ncbi:unnamed protein product [Peniophora sp. CBMAI 1063]|nr:unnamed protein product [Peniophora sp. CBMAI 1063]